MIDRTSVGISPLLSTPMTTYVSSPEVQAASYLPGAVTYSTASVPAVTTQVLDQGYTLPATTTLLPDATTSYLPQATTTTLLPDATTSYLPQATTTLLPDATTSLIPQTTTTLLPDAGFTSFAPQVAVPDQALTSFVQEATPTVIPTADVQGVSVLPTTPITTAVPSVVTPPPATSTIVSSFVDPNTSLVPQPVLEAGGYATTTAGGTPVPPPVPQNGPLGPIMDEDFQRGRPIYDEFSEDRYRGFRFGR